MSHSREKPDLMSADGCARFLDQLFSGEWDDEVEKLDGTEGYLERLLRDSPDPELARRNFAEALDREVTKWQPDRAYPADYLAKVLPLIAAFTPPSGFGKLMVCIQLWLRSNRERWVRATDRELRHQILTTTSIYFPVAPPGGSSADPGFAAYVDALSELLTDRDVAIYALSALTDLHLAPLADPRIVARLTAVPAALEIALTFAMRRALDAKDDELMKQLYVTCEQLGDDTVWALEEAAAAIDSSIERQDEHLIVGRKYQQVVRIIHLSAGQGADRWRRIARD